MADVKPTPTQSENDRAAMGEHVMNKEPDGSPEQDSPAAQLAKDEKEARERRQTTADKPAGGYATRASRAAT